MFTMLTILVSLLLIYALIVTVKLGRAQKPTQNEQYDKHRLKTLVLLSVIYLISIIAGIGLVYLFIFR